MAAEVPPDVMSYLAPHNQSIYDHLSQMLASVAINDSEGANPEDLFNKISREILEDTLAWGPAATPVKVDLTANTHSRDLFKVAQVEADPSSAILSKPPSKLDTYLPDFRSEEELLSWTGLSVGPIETCKVELAIRQLAAAHPELKAIRFWGKVLGIGGDYYVAEGEITALDELPPVGLKDPYHPQRRELEKAVHHNKLKYYVCAYPGAKWTVLPNVRNEQLQDAEKVKKLLSGNLDEPVSSYPPFPGETEASLLRAKIALISAGTVLSPKDYFQEVAADPEIKLLLPSLKPAPDWTPPEKAADLLSIANWTRHYPPIPYSDEIPEDWKPDEETGKYPDVDPEPWPLRPLEEPEPGKQLWITRACGTQYKSLAPVGLFSLEFPGAVVVAKGGKFTSFYHGWGNRETMMAYTPCLHPSMVMPPVRKDDVYRVFVKPPAPVEGEEPPAPEPPAPAYPQEGWKTYNEEQDDLRIQMKTEWPAMTAAESAADGAPPA
mmetsp:Transcript_58749/g.138109  ORF Transcript_58749/g.138109 Transcript_58749/m.138109 type:complete len:493 (-) Transcript_58749:156-1634(-)